jgi:hypothetical protein
MRGIRKGKDQVAIDASAHTPGINKGNAPGNYERQVGHLPDGRATQARSTGINAAKREPIDPRMPNLTPS